MFKFLFLLSIAALTSAHPPAAETYVHYPEVNKYYKFFYEAKTWNQARVQCQKDNATLAMPKKQEELDVMIAKFRHFTKAPSSQMQDVFFMGCHALFERGHFITLKEQRPLPSFLKWQPGEPNGYKIGQHEDCCSMKFNSLMYDSPCFYKTTFFCEKPGTTKTNPDGCVCEEEVYDIDPRFSMAS